MTRSVLPLSIIVALFAAIGCGSSSPGTIGLQPGINGCTNFPDMSGPGEMRNINFGGNLGNIYAPPCMGIGIGQSVRFIGSFDAHPLRPGLAPSQQGGPDAGSPNNPIQATSSGTSVVPFMFPSAGVYPFYCSQHQGQGMFGAIQVR